MSVRICIYDLQISVHTYSICIRTHKIPFPNQHDIRDIHNLTYIYTYIVA